MAEIIITEDNFESEVLDSKLPVLIDFWATWCGPCQMLGPIIAELAEELEGKAKVCKVNVDEQPNLAAAFEVPSIPMVVLMRDGQYVDRLGGLRRKEEILNLLER